jgi:hypothetical protein
MKYIIIISTLFLIAFSACDNHKVGFLITEYAVYRPDSLLVQKDAASEQQIENKIPWLSLPIQGIEGTVPLMMSISNVKSETTFDLDQFKSQVNVRGNGVIEIDFDNTIATGRYLVSIDVKNDGYKQTIPDIFTIIIK